MGLETDLLVERRRLKRQMSLWRVLAIVAAVAALAVGFGFASSGTSLGGRAHVARLSVQGFISDDRRVIQAIDRVATDDNVRALILAIDSPGGSVAGGEALHAAISRVAARKPVIAVMGGTAASAAYMASLPAHRIIARDSTITGSIGVVMQSVDASEFFARLGIRADTLPSGPLKGQPSPLRPLTEEGRAALAAIVADLHAQFVAMVVAGRRLEEARVRELADGRVYTGRQAVGLGLIDAIGGEGEARAWLAAERSVPEAVPVRDLEVRSTTERFFSGAISNLVKSLISEWLVVDAPLSVWQLSR
jgi:protease-4